MQALQLALKMIDADLYTSCKHARLRAIKKSHPKICTALSFLVVLAHELSATVDVRLDIISFVSDSSSQ